MGNIFNDGEIVHTVHVPEEVRKWTFQKKEWGEKTLADYASQFFGDRVKWNVMQSRSHNGSLTGTQITIQNGDERITFMLIEPRGRHRNEVHISKMVESTNEGGILDVLNYEFNGEREKSFNSPFAALAAIKEELPQGAPKRSFRWL